MNDSPKHDELPLPDYDHVPLAVLPSRITSIDEQGLNQIVAYEREHGNRLPVIVTLESRLEAVRNGAAVGGRTPDDLPEVSETQHGSKVTPATSGPPTNPPAKSSPMNPAQPVDR